MYPVTTRINGDVPDASAREAAATIPDEATILVSGFGSVGYPKAVPLALAESARDLSLTIISGGSVGDEIDVALVEANAITRRFPYQARREIRDAINDSAIAFHDRNISSFGDEVLYGKFGDPDVAIVEAVAVGEDWLVPSTSIGHTLAYVESAKRVIVEVNSAQPLSLQALHDVYRTALPPDRKPLPLSAAGDRIGSPRITFAPSKLEAVVRTDRRDSPYTFRNPTSADTTIAENLATFLSEEVTRSVVFEEKVHLQFGVGSLGNALMGAIDTTDFGSRDLIYFGEVIQDGLLDMLDTGRLGSASATSLALSADGQDELFANIDRYAKDIVLRPANISNNPALIDRFGVIAVNSALEVDIYGHVNSTHLKGTKIMNGVGGSGDFNRNAVITVVALPSTVAGRDLSRIVPMASHVDHTEHDIDVIVTEHGVADVRGCSPSERAEAIIENCAHPRFRSELREYVIRANESIGHICHDPASSFSWQSPLQR